ncbi:plasmid partitioning protein RepA [Cereibacter changlensis JA139]|uniref:Plasmid partitioning protein RepA n=2 Tax=Cereibacter changlensis TaxID=402884 RepID=A0A2T4JT34_9RHOB|nr:plasmid partitioning protein RepA [Cereibacter changlensis]PTE21054.1 plasmid partitioning protein RepA [Cereibacter changlensis JA139]PZX56257.1 chromosome partitioning protein [Cereibacter changlensis]
MNSISHDMWQAVSSSQLGACAETLASALDEQFREAHQPGGSKTLRKFAVGEVSDLLGVSPANLRMRHKDGSLPEVESDARGHRYYSAEEIDKIRDVLFRTGRGKSAAAYRPGRREGDRLQVISCVNFKGGSSKTTTAIHLAQRYALRGYRVLALDLDAQASLTTLFGFRPEVEFAEGGTIYDALRYADLDAPEGERFEPVPLRDVIRKTYFHNLDLAPAGLMLSEYETETANNLRDNRHTVFARRLSEALESVEDDYDLVIIDCPPQLGFTTLSALTASTGLVVTVVPGMLDIASMSQFLKLVSETLDAVSNALGEPIAYSFVKFLVTRYEPNDGPQRQTEGYLRAILKDMVMVNPMLKSTAISDAGMTHQTVYEVDPRDFIRTTLDRALGSVNDVSNELEGIIQKVWGR